MSTRRPGWCRRETLRVWRIYLAGCAFGFERGWINVYQMLGSLNRTPGPTELPLTRDWIYAVGPEEHCARPRRNRAQSGASGFSVNTP